MSEVKHVVRAIHNVLKALSIEGIAKDQRNDQQRFMFRGIDAVLNALSGHLAANDLIIIPRVTERTVAERETKSGGALFSVACKIEYDFISAQDGSTVTAVLYGEAMDSGDKATNKAMSAAYKYMAIQSFAIPTEAIQDNDADASSPPEVKGRQQEKREAADRPEQERQPVQRPTDTGRVSGQQQNKSNAPQQSKAKHPILLQLEAALNKYGKFREKGEARILAEFKVESIDRIPHATLPQALLSVQVHQKELRAQAAAAKNAQKPAAKKPAGKKAQEPAPPDDGDVPEQEHDQDDQGHDDSGIPV